MATAQGPVVGRVEDGVASWKNIPYAAPPVGALRWLAPAPPPARDAPRDASAYGPRCPQDDRGAVTPGVGPTGVEDCLQLNVWAPADADGASRLPVLFWIHGGGMVQGSGTEALYDGSALARLGVVVVTINYRLGALGFLAHPAFVGDDPRQPAAGNYGLLDQQAALGWVGQNIHAFGGDAGRIAVFGESAGGVSVCSQLASPGARGLFAAAAMQSGNCLTTSIPALDVARGTVPAAFDQGRRFAAAAGCADAGDVAACLRALPLETIMATLPGEVGILQPDAETYGPIIDGTVLLEPPGDAVRAGRAAPVPLIAGATADEGTIFVPQRPLSYAQFALLVRGLFPSAADEVLAAYTERDYPDGRDALAAVTGDVSFVCPARRTVRDHASWGHDAWLYHFTRVPAYAVAAGIGAHHGVEIPYLFDSAGALARRAMTAADRAIVARMQADWTALARDGRPDAARSPAWPATGAAPLAGLELGDAIDVESGWRAARCDLWDEVAGWAPRDPSAATPGPTATARATATQGPTRQPSATPSATAAGRVYLPSAGANAGAVR